MTKKNREIRPRPGQRKAEMVFCPIFGDWISDIRCFEITVGRRLYDDTKRDEEAEIQKHSQTVKEATLNSGRVFPEQLTEVLAICGFCEEHCLGKTDGPYRIPPYQSTTRNL